jgi:ornithine carrier protein
MDSKTSPSFADSPLAQAAMASPKTEQIASQSTEAMKDIVFGSIAGMLGKIVEYPFDTVKVRLQSQPDHLPLRYAGPLDCFRQSIQQDGVRGLYRGVSAPLLGAAAETSCLFFSYRVAQDVIRVFRAPTTKSKADESLPLSSLVLAGGMSGAVTSLILTPIELVKCRMQVPLTSSMDPTLRNASIGPAVVIRDVYKREGLAGFWRGQLGTLLRETGGGAAWFGCYETFSLFFRQRAQAATGEKDPKIPIWQSMIAGAGAGLGYNFSFYPADTIKSKMQTGDLSSIGANGGRQTFFGVGRALYRTHGLKGLYRGCGITLLRSGPSSALIFTIYESLRTYFG